MKKKLVKNKKQVALIVLDGWGYREDKKNNAIASANHPFFDSIWKEFPHSLLEASGLAVGLPEGQIGNSEVGHTTIGAGKTLDTDLVRINKAVKDGKFGKNSEFQKLFRHVKKNNSVLHVLGLVSPGGVHSHSDHLIAFLEAAKTSKVKKVAIHVFSDGRDVPPQSAIQYLKELEGAIEKIGLGFVASLSGRFYAMDRDNNWDRLKKAEDVIFDGKSKFSVETSKPSELISKLYKNGEVDEHLEPRVFTDSNGKTCHVSKNDGVFFMNFRADRAKMLSSRIVQKSKRLNLCFVTMTSYDSKIKSLVAFPLVNIETTLAKEISRAGLKQVHIAETEKFAHVTSFFNGGISKPHKGEKQILIPSRKDVLTHDLAPEMRAEAIADEAVREINKKADFIIVNFANPDMVGHTANIPAIKKAIEEVDVQLKKVVEAVLKVDGIAVVTADHGNAEVNIDDDGLKHTAHTTNLVPIIICGKNLLKLKKGTLSDIAPTILELFKLKKPKSMIGKSLFY